MPQGKMADEAWRLVKPKLKKRWFPEKIEQWLLGLFWIEEPVFPDRPFTTL